MSDNQKSQKAETAEDLSCCNHRRIAALEENEVATRIEQMAAVFALEPELTGKGRALIEEARLRKKARARQKKKAVSAG